VGERRACGARARAGGEYSGVAHSPPDYLTRRSSLTAFAAPGVFAPTVIM
jgi:hypothetical protein